MVGFALAGCGVAPGMLAGVVTVRCMRGLSGDEIAWKSRDPAKHQELARRWLASFERLARPGPDRRAWRSADLSPGTTRAASE